MWAHVFHLTPSTEERDEIVHDRSYQNQGVRLEVNIFTMIVFIITTYQ